MKPLILSLSLLRSRMPAHAPPLTNTVSPSPTLSLALFFSCVPAISSSLCLSLSRFQIHDTRTNAYKRSRCTLAPIQRAMCVRVCVCPCVCMQGHRNPLTFFRSDVEGLFGVQQVSCLWVSLRLSSSRPFCKKIRSHICLTQSLSCALSLSLFVIFVYIYHNAEDLQMQHFHHQKYFFCLPLSLSLRPTLSLSLSCTCLLALSLSLSLSLLRLLSRPRSCSLALALTLAFMFSFTLYESVGERLMLTQ